MRAIVSLPYWLRRMIKRGANRFRCLVDEDDEEPKVVKVEEEKSGRPRNLKGLETSLSALGKVRIEALNGDGDVLDVFIPPGMSAPPDDELPGYMKDANDTDPERLLKTFAHLLADAHRLASRQLVEVVQIQSAAFSDERRHLTAAMATTERLLRRATGSARVRVAADENEEEAAEPDFMTSLLGPMLQRMVRDEVTKTEPAPPANGAKGDAE